MPPLFNINWYSCLNDQYSGLPPEEVPTRFDIQTHLVILHQRIWATDGPHQAYDLHPHWNPGNLTCYLFPNPYNNGHVREIFLRYGKSRAQIESFAGAGLDEEGSFRHHVHIAIGLSEGAFFFQLSFSPWAFRDYAHLRNILGLGNNRSQNLFQAIADLAPAEYVVWGPFGLDVQLTAIASVDGLLSVLPQNTEDWIVLRRNLLPDDPQLDSGSIVQTTLAELGRLYPVYDAVALRNPEI